MQYDKKLGIAIFAMLILVAIASSFFITSLTVSDVDPSTYVIVPILMLPLFAVFFAKNKLKLEIARKDIVIAIALFLILVIATIYLRFQLSYLFLGYRIDMLLFPILIASFVLLLFGSKNFKKFIPIMVYSLLASSLLLAPVIQANQGFAVLNTIMIYSIAKTFVHGLSYVAPITIAANGYQVGIGQTCVGVGVLIGILLFLIPLAYLYEGSNRRKALWVLSGFVLLLVLNTLRMLLIAIAWITYGPSNAILVIHLFAGILLFYLSIIVMILLAGKYGLSMGGKASKKKVPTPSGYIKAGIVLAVLIAFAYFLFTYNYSTALVISPVYLNNEISPNFTASSFPSIAGSVINKGPYSASLKIINGSSAIVILSGANLSSNNSVLVYLTYTNSSVLPVLLKNSIRVERIDVMGDDGLSGVIYDLQSNNTEFFIYNTEVPYVFSSGSYMRLDSYVIVPASSGRLISCNGGYDTFYTYALNLFNPVFYNQTFRDNALNEYCGLAKLVS